MRDVFRRRPSPAMAVALLALFVSLGGVSYGVAKNVIGSGQIKNNSVRGKDVRNRTITGKDVKGNALGGTQIKESALGQVPNALSADSATKALSADSATAAASATSASQVATLKPFGLTRVAPSASNADLDAARAAATKVPLVSKGPLTLYAKCYSQPQGEPNEFVRAEVFAETTQNGTVLQSDNTTFEGNSSGFLNTDTPETQRDLNNTGSFTPAPGGVANMAASDEFAFFMAAPDGSVLSGHAVMASKTGTIDDPVGGNGIYGPGPACMFSGFAVIS